MHISYNIIGLLIIDQIARKTKSFASAGDNPCTEFVFKLNKIFGVPSRRSQDSPIWREHQAAERFSLPKGRENGDGGDRQRV